jgi:hypothetical protein
MYSYRPGNPQLRKSNLTPPESPFQELEGSSPNRDAMGLFLFYKKASHRNF